MAPPPPPTRRRCVVLTDDTTISCYTRNTHETHTVVLEPSGHAYSYIQPNGTRSRHLTPTTLSTHRAMVLDSLALRNRFASQPYLHLRLLAPRNVQRQRRMTSPRAHWPTSTDGKLRVDRLRNSEKGCFELQSIDGAAKVQLHASAQLVDVHYRVEVKASDDEPEVQESERSLSSHAHYTTVRQSFAVDHVPESFSLPVRVLLAARTAWSHDNQAEIDYRVNEGQQSAAVSMLPTNSAFTARLAFSAIAPQLETASSGLSLAEILRVATLPSKLLYQRTAVEIVADDATFFISRPPAAPPNVVVQLNHQNELLTASAGFFTWFDASGRQQQRFTGETIPPASMLASTNTSCSVLSLCQHVDYVLMALKYSGQDDTKPASPPVEIQDVELVEQVENERGRFRAFRDGHVRVVFADRTILQTDQDGEICCFFFPDGSSGQTTLSSAPLWQRAYIHQALEFGDWALASHEERLQRHFQRQEAQAVIARELQRISVRCGLNGAQQAAESEQEAQQGSKASALAGISLSGVRELQTATQRHMASVARVLEAAAAATK